MFKDLESNMSELYWKMCSYHQLKRKTTKEEIPVSNPPWECSRLQRARNRKLMRGIHLKIRPHITTMPVWLSVRNCINLSKNGLKEQYEEQLAKGIKYKPGRFFPI